MTDPEKSTKSTRSASSSTRGSTSTSLSSSESIEEALLKPSKSWFVNSVAVLVVCPTHSKLALAPLSDHPFSPRNLWFPMASLVTGTSSIAKTLESLLNQVASPRATSAAPLPVYKASKLVHTLRLQVPKSLDFVARHLFVAELMAAKKNCPCSSSSTSSGSEKLVTWYQFGDVLKLSNLHGPEPAMAATFLLSNPNQPNVFPESCQRSYEISVKKLTVAANTGANSALLRAAGYTPKKMQLLYSDYIQSCWPSPYMMSNTLKEYFSRALPDLAFSTELDLGGLVKAFRSTQQALYIDFFEFSAGLAVLEPRTPHTGQYATARHRCIFRYYNHSGGAGLSYKELSNLMQDLVKLQGDVVPEDEDAMVAKMLEAEYSRLGLDVKKPVTFEAFANIRGSADLLRAKMPLLDQLHKRPLHFPLSCKPMSTLPCASCREKQYTLAAHFVTIRRNGIVVEPILLDYLADVKRMPKTLRTLSDATFNTQVLANHMLAIIREYADGASNADWRLPSKRYKLKDSIIQLCEQVKAIVCKEPRILRITSPCIVFGDIHGNLIDLKVYEQIFWRAGPACVTTNFLFLGDYVDRGGCSIEVSIYLMCLKILAPGRFHLLRGNHELRQIQQSFTFPSECRQKFDHDGPAIWEHFNLTFDCFPLAAVIDEKIYCAHGGIPTSEINLKLLADMIPCPMDNPLVDCLPVWELLWNDPITQEEYNQQMAQLREQGYPTESLPDGCLPNTKRATAYFFSPKAVQNFFAENGLSHVIRGHEVVMPGFVFHDGGRVITVFSSSRYCNFDNAAAVMLVEGNKIRPIKVET